MTITRTFHWIKISMVICCMVFIVATGCKTRSQEERVAKQYCGSCHLFPDPTLLDKKTWRDNVLPQMAFRMGLNPNLLSKVPSDDLPIVLRTLPPQPMLTEQEFELIRNYFLKHAPDTIILPKRNVDNTLKQFTILSPASFQKPFITMLTFDSVRQRFYAGTRYSDLYTLDNTFAIVDSTKLHSPPSYIFVNKNESIVSVMGIMDPNDQAKGKLIHFKNDFKDGSILKDSLQRPVYFEKTDLNNDGYEDIIVCTFGNVTGALLLFEATQSGSFIKHVLNTSPGARKVVTRDFDGDGSKDIIVLLTQADERLLLYSNKGNFNFKENTLLHFPPVHGSSYFEIDDFNNDGNFDILLTNGDNGDYTDILKPYHSVSIFENDGKNKFTKVWSFGMPGASQAMANDFDHDGDLDIAAISFFPDFVNTPEQTFLYFENLGNNNFTAHTTSLASTGRWIVMETCDYDNDHDTDIVLGSMNFKGFGAKDDIYMHWMESPSTLLVLKNNLISTK